MPANTPNLSLPYPLLTDAADIETFGVKPLAEALDAYLATMIGSIVATARSTAPTGWLLCDGAAVSRSTYAALFSAIGTAYGVGNGTTTFNIPDFRGRVPVGVDGAAARLTANDALGNSGGEEKHVLAFGESQTSHLHNTGQGLDYDIGAFHADFNTGRQSTARQARTTRTRRTTTCSRTRSSTGSSRPSARRGRPAG